MILNKYAGEGGKSTSEGGHFEGSNKTFNAPS